MIITLTCQLGPRRFAGPGRCCRSPSAGPVRHNLEDAGPPEAVAPQGWREDGDPPVGGGDSEVVSRSVATERPADPEGRRSCTADPLLTTRTIPVPVTDPVGART